MSIEIDDGSTPLFDLHVKDDSQTIQIRAIKAGTGLLIRPFGNNSVELRAISL